ncbi:MAG TPA: Na+/H+ antiporter NhaA [Actinomycetota bacterium]|nr:Na+/H+ antiporter NhaA [Actinomycetota bacterium]
MGAGGPDDRALRPSWLRSERPIPRRLLRPLQQFLETEHAGGLVLLVGAVAALAWANSPWAHTYRSFWHTELRVELGPWSLSHDLREWVNDALMVLFFFVVGLEIKRELVTGELRGPRRAALPALAAAGGMLVPALLYVAFNPPGTEAFRGWGIPMATDIAFAVGVLALVGRGVPGGLKAFLLALAIVDDIGAIAVIALFYSGPIAWPALVAAGGLLGTVALLRELQVRHTVVYVALGVGVWLATLQSGVHATIAGVALGLLTPAVPFQRPRAVREEAERVAVAVQDRPWPADADAHRWLRLGALAREAVSPVARLETLLHPWTSFVVVPVFALANAGVSLSPSAARQALTDPVALGVMVGLVVGKPVGIILAAWLGVRAGLARLPAGVRWSQVAGAGAVAGIGFTVSLFIAELAFVTESATEVAKVGILSASVVASLLGWAVLRAARGAAPGPPL